MLELGDGGLDGTCEIGELAEHQGFEVGQLSDLGGDLAGEADVSKDGEGVDTVGVGITLDIVPVGTAVGVGFP